MHDRLVPVMLLVASLGAAGSTVAARAAGAPPGPQVLTLAQAIAAATGGTPAVQIAGLRAEGARARVAVARGALLPSLSGVASQTNRTLNSRTFGFEGGGLDFAFPEKLGPFDVVDARFEAHQTLFDASSWVRLRAAHEGLDALEADRGTSVERAAESAAYAYLQAARAEALVAARSADLDLARALVEIADAQVQQGVSAPIDGTRARTQMAATEGALIVARNRRDRAGIALVRALGLDPAAAVVVRDTLDASGIASDAPADSAQAVALALSRRPELVAEQARGRKARAERTAISAERLPRLEVSADYGLSGNHFSDAIETRGVAVALTLPLLDGLRREARIHEQAAVASESEVRLRDLRMQVVADVRSALLDLASATEQLRIAARRLDLADAEVNQARERFEQGVAGNIEVIDAQTSLIRARDADIDARYAAAASRVALARAIGVTTTLH